MKRDTVKQKMWRYEEDFEWIVIRKADKNSMNSCQLNPTRYETYQIRFCLRLLYASPAWWGFTNASQRDRLEAFIRKSIRLGFCPDNVGSFQSMCEGSDEQFFNAIKNNPSHVLSHLLQNKPNSGYDLHPREHNYVLPDNTTHLADCNFINSILYKNII